MTALDAKLKRKPRTTLELNPTATRDFGFRDFPKIHLFQVTLQILHHTSTCKNFFGKSLNFPERQPDNRTPCAINFQTMDSLVTSF
jgi:hypothetical protein